MAMKTLPVQWRKPVSVAGAGVTGRREFFIDPHQITPRAALASARYPDGYDRTVLGVCRALAGLMSDADVSQSVTGSRRWSQSRLTTGARGCRSTVFSL